MLFIGIAFFNQLGGDVDHGLDMLRGFWVAGRFPYSQGGYISLEFPDIGFREVGKRLACFFSTLDGIVVQIGEIHIKMNIIAFVAQNAVDQVSDNKASAVRQVGMFMGGRSTGIKGYFLL